MSAPKVALETARYTDVTTIAKELSSEYDIYEKILVCPDIKTFWVARIQLDINEEFEKEEGKVLIERNNIEEFEVSREIRRSIALNTQKKLVEKVLQADVDNGFENWDNLECESLEDAIDELGDGYKGIINENEVA